MSLVEDLREGFKLLEKRDYSVRDELEKKDWAAVTIPFTDAPVPLRDGELIIQVRLASSRRFFTLYSPLAMLTDALEASPLEHLMRRQFYADQVGGASFAIMQINDVDVLTSVIHWTLGSISPEDFATFFDNFQQAIFTLIDEVANLADHDQPLQPVHG